MFTLFEKQQLQKNVKLAFLSQMNEISLVKFLYICLF